MYYFYMWRFGWVFYLIGLFFAVMAFFTGFLACCGRLGSAISGLVSLAALFFYTIAVSLMTYVIHLPTHSPVIVSSRANPHLPNPQCHLRQSTRRLPRRRPRRHHWHLGFRLQLGRLGGASHCHGAVLPGNAQE